jgi:hypothetical protein
MNKIIENSTKDTTWLNEAKWRQDNEAWLDISFAITVKILRTLRKKNISKEEFAKLLDIPIEDVDIMLKGSTNFTLKLITDIEKVLDTILIKIYKDYLDKVRWK